MDLRDSATIPQAETCTITLGRTHQSPIPSPASPAHAGVGRHRQEMFKLHQLYHLGSPLSEPSNLLHELRSRAINDENRSTRIGVSGMELAFLTVQSAIILVLLVFVTSIEDLDLVWQCPGEITWNISLWLGGICILAGTIRPLWDSSFLNPREILHLRSIPSSIHAATCKNCSVNAIPPLGQGSGFLSRLRTFFRNEHSRFQLSKYIHLTTHRIFTTLTIIGEVSSVRHFFHYTRMAFKNQVTQHPMVVIIERSEAESPTTPMKPLLRIIQSYLQALILIGLTFLFGSAYGLDLLYSLLFVLSFFTLVVVSRTYSIYLCQWLEIALDATVINYDTPAEFQAIRTIITGMPNVLVKSINAGYTYSGGYRLDRNNNCLCQLSQGQSIGNPRTIGSILGLVTGATVGCGLIILCDFIRPTEFDYYQNALTFAMAFGVIIALYLYSKIDSDFHFIDLYDIHQRLENSDLESAHPTSTDGGAPAQTYLMTPLTPTVVV